MASPGLGYKRQPSLIAATTGTGQAVDCLGTTYASVYFTGTGTISGGSVVIETADYNESQASLGYTGTWSPVGSAFDPTTVSGGKQLQVTLGAGPWAYIRVRVATNLSGSGGTVTAVVVAV